MIKAIFTDIDGTLLSHRTKRAPVSAVRALQQLQRQGILVFACTGRPLVDLLKLPLGGMEFDGFVTLNGQLVLDKEQRLVYGNPLSDSVSREIVKLFTDCRLPIILMQEKQIYVNHVNDLVKWVHEQICSPVPQVQSYSGAPIYQACVYLKDAGEEQFLLSCLPDEVRVCHWNTGGVDVIPTTGGKALGMKALLEHLGIAPQDVMALGDGDNDTDMLAFAGIGVAMGNGAQCAKEAADFVTADIDEDGLEKALIHFGLI